MILLRPDCLVFNTADGDNVPCPAEAVTVEILGEAVKMMDEEMVKNAAEAVLHYFKFEQGRTLVTLGEFTQALERVLGNLGLRIKPEPVEISVAAPEPMRVVETDLRRLAGESGENFELLFFPRLRAELRSQLGQSPQVVRFSGLRTCVKRLVGAQRWGRRCQRLEDQIVDFLRTCLSAETSGADCALVVH